MPEVVKERVAQNVVTPDNLTAFNLKHLRMEPLAEPKKEDAPKVEEKNEPEAKEEKKAEEPKKEEKKEEPKKAHPIQERFGEMAEQRKKAEAEAKQERELRLKAEAEAAELREKLAPKPPAEELGAKPKLADFENDADKWGDALIQWHAKKDAKEKAVAAAKEAEALQARTWADRVAQAKKEIPDFAEKIDSGKDIMLSPDMHQAIIESEFGPRIIYYFAEHPEEHARISKLSAYGQVREIGKLETIVMPKQKEEKTEPKKEAEISKAPAPIEPLKTTAGGEVQTKLDDQGNFTGSVQEWKALRKAGKIK